ncbi:hypothetical protein CL619_04195 [archaeon]|nr:hypothetical protein [archaeon]|tara:strand:+ start:851 stop:1204 length:354 start_codon:yes stop_codon:yes gene_type:complete
MGKSSINLLEMWPEYSVAILLVLGFALSIATQSATVSIVTAICIGALAARIIFFMRNIQPLTPYAMVVIALIVGFIAGSFFANRFLITILILGSFFLSYYLHDKKIIQTFKSKPFLK